MRNFPLKLRTLRRNPEKPETHQLYQNFKSVTVTSQSLLKERCESGKSQSSYIKFYASGVSVRRGNPCERSRSSSAGRPRDFAPRPSRLFSISPLQWRALIGSDVRRSGKRLMCFAHFRNILSVTAELHPLPPPLPYPCRSSRRSPQHFSIVASAFLALAAPGRIALLRTVTTFSAVLLHGIPRRGYSVPSRVIFPHADVVRTFGQSTYIAPFVRGRAKVQHPRAPRPPIDPLTYLF